MTSCNPFHSGLDGIILSPYYAERAWLFWIVFRHHARFRFVRTFCGFSWIFRIARICVLSENRDIFVTFSCRVMRAYIIIREQEFSSHARIYVIIREPTAGTAWLPTCRTPKTKIGCQRPGFLSVVIRSCLPNGCSIRPH